MAVTSPAAYDIISSVIGRLAQISPVTFIHSVCQMVKIKDICICNLSEKCFQVKHIHVGHLIANIIGSKSAYSNLDILTSSRTFMPSLSSVENLFPPYSSQMTASLRGGANLRPLCS